VAEHILIVEDDENIRDMLQTALEMKAYSLSFARDGLEALELLQTTTPSLILLDLHLPRMDGYAVLETLEKQWPELSHRIIIITADSQAVARLAQKSIKIIPKPFSLHAIYALIEETLKSGKET
jgi:two-component system, chemotaxis family, chemotaxis protein CheY